MAFILRTDADAPTLITASASGDHPASASGRRTASLQKIATTPRSAQRSAAVRYPPPRSDLSSHGLIIPAARGTTRFSVYDPISGDTTVISSGCSALSTMRAQTGVAGDQGNRTAVTAAATLDLASDIAIGDALAGAWKDVLEGDLRSKCAARIDPDGGGARRESRLRLVDRHLHASAASPSSNHLGALQRCLRQSLPCLSPAGQTGASSPRPTGDWFARSSATPVALVAAQTDRGGGARFVRRLPDTGQVGVWSLTSERAPLTLAVLGVKHDVDIPGHCDLPVVRRS